MHESLNVVQDIKMTKKFEHQLNFLSLSLDLKLQNVMQDMHYRTIHLTILVNFKPKIVFDMIACDQNSNCMIRFFKSCSGLLK